MNKLATSGWLPASFNNGWTYMHAINNVDEGHKLLEVLARHYKHSTTKDWQRRLLAGQIQLNKITTTENQSILHHFQHF